MLTADTVETTEATALELLKATEELLGALSTAVDAVVASSEEDAVRPLTDGMGALMKAVAARIERS